MLSNNYVKYSIYVYTFKILSYKISLLYITIPPHKFELPKCRYYTGPVFVPNFSKIHQMAQNLLVGEKQTHERGPCHKSALLCKTGKRGCLCTSSPEFYN